ncbi:UNVERIFIED_CONTAM: hypothetical protein HDU68_011340 [Siphonaria sp. JEL0065]|nr:hypothetical protein HDU68_011337 [Siphonaria sp. JEL0065]KAJ3029727.1 hypothetical protein HDU68_011340 [Siphonaria sp. JEL0065]
MWKTLVRQKSTLSIRNASPEREQQREDVLVTPSPTASPALTRAPSPSPSLPLASPLTASLPSLTSTPKKKRTSIRTAPLVAVQAVTSIAASTKYVPLGVTPEAALLLSSLKGPLSIAVFAGFGRSGKSRVASRVAFLLDSWNDSISNNLDHEDVFVSKPGNIPCTHGIDLAVVKHPDASKGHILILDCEGAHNHNQTAIPFVMGLAARLASRIFVFERGCFTTAGLESVMQIVNMGLATIPVQDDPEDDSFSSQQRQQPDLLTRSLVLVENMSINSGIPSTNLLSDLLSCSNDGDEMSNRVKSLVRDQFNVSFEKLPFCVGGMGGYRTDLDAEFDDVCKSMAGDLVDGLKRLEIGGVAADGALLVELCNELLTQIRNGGSRFNMISATESLVSNMATEAANTVWKDFLSRAKNSHNTPQQIKQTGRKHLRTILRELEGFQNMALIDLESFTCRLQPREPAVIARVIWDRNYTAFLEEVVSAHGSSRVVVSEKKSSLWTVRMNRFVVDLVDQFVEALRQLVRLARFGSLLVVLTNYYFWKHGWNLIKNFAGSVISEVLDGGGVRGYTDAEVVAEMVD